ncbi:hypothetical protein SDC9_196747 [bioreactor metagenome]|uniref:Uncharacterized protein n=1 Tax=bioreactor metagenome TaxID=1076179 RepID=A0A645ILE2_9ZZZZ
MLDSYFAYIPPLTSLGVLFAHRSDVVLVRIDEPQAKDVVATFIEGPEQLSGFCTVKIGECTVPGLENVFAVRAKLQSAQYVVRLHLRHFHRQAAHDWRRLVGGCPRH